MIRYLQNKLSLKFNVDDEIKTVVDVMKTVEGRRFVYYLLEKNKAFSIDQLKDPYDIMYHAGASQVTSSIIAILLSKANNYYSQMIEENTSHE